MGTSQGKGLSRQIEAKKLNQKQITTEFQSCHQHWVANPNFINQILTENTKLKENLLKFFPNAARDYQQFAEMAMFLRKTQVKPEKSAFAKENAPKTQIIDRFFMIVLQIANWQAYEKILMASNQLENLLLQLMTLFIPNPQKGFIDKIRKLLGIENIELVNLKDFSNSLRKNFPNITKHLRDYTTMKFRDMIKQCYLLQNFKSGILQQDAVILSWRIPELAGKEIKRLYDSDSCGLSFHSYEKRIIGYEGPWLILIQSTDKEITYKFGSFQSGPIRDIIDYQGDLRGFMFSIEPTIRFMTTDKGHNANHYFFINTIDEKVSKRRRGIGFGGDFGKQNCKLWIDQDLDKSTVFNGDDPTYGFGQLANPLSTALAIRKMEIWGLGTKFDLEKQALYWQQREDEAMKRRKVNKKQLIDGNAGFIFEKTFAHRDQVYGDIQRNKPKQQQR